MKKKIIINIKKQKIRNIKLMEEWQSGLLRTKVITNKKKKVKKFDWKKDMTDYLSTKSLKVVFN